LALRPLPPPSTLFPYTTLFRSALALLLVLIIRYKFQAFVALLVVSLALGLAAGLPPVVVVVAVGKGIGEILAGVAVILALGAMLDRKSTRLNSSHVAISYAVFC